MSQQNISNGQTFKSDVARLQELVVDFKRRVVGLSFPFLASAVQVSRVTGWTEKSEGLPVAMYKNHQEEHNDKEAQQPNHAENDCLYDELGIFTNVVSVL